MIQSVTICTPCQVVFGDNQIFKELKELENSKEKMESFSEWTLELNPESENFGKVIKKKFGFVPLRCIEVLSATISKHLGLEKLEGKDETLNKM